MIAAQNNDFSTAKTCFELGADAYAKSPEGLTAIEFSCFFDHQDVTNVILNHGGSLPRNRVMHGKVCCQWYLNVQILLKAGMML